MIESSPARVRLARLTAARKLFGAESPLLTTTLAASPALLRWWVALDLEVMGTAMPALTRNLLQVRIASRRQSPYCLAAYAAAARRHGADQEHVDQAAAGRAVAPELQALLRVVDQLDADQLTTRHAARVDEPTLAELLLVVTHTRLTIQTDQYLRVRRQR